MISPERASLRYHVSARPRRGRTQFPPEKHARDAHQSRGRRVPARLKLRGGRDGRPEQQDCNRDREHDGMGERRHRRDSRREPPAEEAAERRDEEKDGEKGRRSARWRWGPPLRHEERGAHDGADVHREHHEPEAHQYGRETSHRFDH